MADNNNPRYRSNDPYRGVGSGTPAPSSNDPLAELARLIGQNDPFAEFGRDGSRRAGAADMHRAPAAEQDWGAPAPDAYADPRTAYPADPAYAQQPVNHAPLADPQGYPQTYPAQGYEQQSHHPGPRHEYAQEPQGYDPAHYDRAPHAAAEPQYQAERQPPEFLGQRGFGQQAYGQEAYGQDAYPHGAQAPDDIYDDVPPSRRRGIVLAAAAVALIVIGTAGAFGYRALFGSVGSGPPPVIKADTAPSKILPAVQRDSASGKLIQDRVSERPAGERIVSREEQPSDVKPAPRVVFPGPAANGPAAAPAQAAALPPGAAALAATEPKKIRTVAIRPDQPAGTEPPATAGRASGPPVARTASVAPAASAPAPRPPASNGGPLSLTPDGAAPAPAPVAPARTASVPRVAPAPVQSSVAAGTYVQVTSQRSEADAQASVRALQAKYPVLAGQPVVIRRADLGAKGTYYRAMVGPYGSPDEANNLCGSLKTAGGSCIVQKN